MSQAADMLREFFQTFGAETHELAEGLLRREWDELDDALDALNAAVADPQRFDRTYREHVAREMADVAYTLYGDALALGIDLDVALAAVHAANMAKLPDCANCGGDGSVGVSECPACHYTGKGKQIKRESDGKVLKPKGWQEPDMSRAVKGSR
jgi:predicted HAD superfamily Cof-like phosphohydrolase